MPHTRTKTLYVGNLPFRLSSNDFNNLFEEFGPIYSSKLINDTQTGRPKGFGFIELDEDKAENAIEALNGSTCDGRDILVAIAKDQNPRHSMV